MSELPADKGCKAFFEAIAREEETSFKNFFEQYRKRVYSLAYKLTKSVFAAEEITQEVFISVWSARRHLSAVKDAETYFYTIIYNKVSRHLKKEANKALILRLSLANATRSSNETEETIDANEGQRFVNKALAQLSPQKKLIYELSRKEGKSHDEIAMVLRLSPHTVKSHLVKALKFIRNYMKNNALFLVWLLCSFFA
jgi:RNA polymerase sigma-70 factor (family 1)